MSSLSLSSTLTRTQAFRRGQGSNALVDRSLVLQDSTKEATGGVSFGTLADRSGTFTIQFKVPVTSSTMVSRIAIMDIDERSGADAAAASTQSFLFAQDVGEIAAVAADTLGTGIARTETVDGFIHYEIVTTLPAPATGNHEIRIYPAWAATSEGTFANTAQDVTATGGLRVVDLRWESTPQAGLTTRPEYFGAVGDNVADDTTAISAALATGRLVVLDPAKTYYAPSLSYSGAINLDGRGATIRGNDSGGPLRPQGVSSIRNVKLSNYAIGVYTPTTDGGSVTRLVVEGCDFTAMTRGGIHVGVAVGSALIAGNNFTAISATTSSAYAIQIGENTYASQDTWEDVNVTGNRIDGVTATGSDNAWGILVYGRGAQISGNSVSNVTVDTGECWGIYTKDRYAVVTGNRVEDLNSNTPALCFAYNIKGSERDETGSPQGFMVNVTGNLAHDIEGAGFRAANEDVTFASNVADTCADGFYMGTEGKYDNVRFLSNTARICSDRGFSISGGGDGLQIVGNLAAQCQNGGITLGGGAGTIKGVQVCNNMLDGCNLSTGTAALYVSMGSGDSCSEFQINGNHIIDCVGDYAISVGYVTNFQVHDNNWEDSPLTGGNQRGIFLTTGAKSYTMRGNSGWERQTTTASRVNIAQLRFNNDGVFRVRATVIGHDATNDEVAVFTKSSVWKYDGTLAQVGSTRAIESEDSQGTVNDLIFTLTSGTYVAVQVGGVASATYEWRAYIEAEAMSA